MRIDATINKTTFVVEVFMNTVGEFFGCVFESMGCVLFDVLSKAGEKTGFPFPFLWLGSTLKGLLSLLATMVKMPFALIGGVAAGCVNLLYGFIAFSFLFMAVGIQDVFSAVMGMFILLLGKLIAFIQSAFYLQGFERRLSPTETKQLEKVFGSSIHLYTVRVMDSHAGVLGLIPSAFTLGNTIYVKTKCFYIDLLIHESTHVWQYRKKGCRYVSDALLAQCFIADGNNWENEIKLRGKTMWTAMNVLAQSEFIQDLWKRGKLCDDDNRILKVGDGAYFKADGVKTFGKFNLWFNDYSNFAADATHRLQQKWF